MFRNTFEISQKKKSKTVLEQSWKFTRTFLSVPKTNLKYFKHSELCKVLNTILLETFRVNYFSAQSEMFQTNKKCSGTLRNDPKQSPDCFRTFSNVLMFLYNSEMFFQSYLKCFETIWNVSKWTWNIFKSCNTLWNI